MFFQNNSLKNSNPILTPKQTLKSQLNKKIVPLEVKGWSLNLMN